jgi:glutamate-1-semialdehyde 2,1-aminomutase
MNYERSEQLHQRAINALAGGVSSQVRAAETPVPLFFERGAGSHLWDVDGNEYVDFVMGQGPNIFGHAPEFLNKAVSNAIDRGVVFAGQHEVELEVAETIKRIIPAAELVRFGSSGSEVTHAAIRLARAHTGRQKFIKFEGQYHGWLDSVLYSVAPNIEAAGAYDAPNTVAGSGGMSPGTAGEVVVVPWNDADALEATLQRHAGEIAAIITEPYMCNTNCITPEFGYLERMRELCDEHGVVLIFDEVITGFRVALGGAQEATGVTPDLATYAKAMAGGFPVAMFCGKQEIMDHLEGGATVHAGTLNANTVAMSATAAALTELQRNDGEAYRRLYATGRALMAGLRDAAARAEVPMLVQGPGPLFNTSFTAASEVTDYRSHAQNVDAGKFAEFQRAMQDRGVRITTRGTWMVSTAHTENDIDRAISTAEEVLASL